MKRVMIAAKMTVPRPIHSILVRLCLLFMIF